MKEKKKEEKEGGKGKEGGKRKEGGAQNEERFRRSESERLSGFFFDGRTF